MTATISIRCYSMLFLVSWKGVSNAYFGQRASALMLKSIYNHSGDKAKYDHHRWTPRIQE